MLNKHQLSLLPSHVDHRLEYVDEPEDRLPELKYYLPSSTALVESCALCFDSLMVGKHSLMNLDNGLRAVRTSFDSHGVFQCRLHHLLV